jgi:hypothetical protein
MSKGEYALFRNTLLYTMTDTTREDGDHEEGIVAESIQSSSVGRLIHNGISNYWSLPTWNTIKRVGDALTFPRAVAVVTNAGVTIGGAVHDIESLLRLACQKLEATCKRKSVHFKTGNKKVIGFHPDGTGQPTVFKASFHHWNNEELRNSVHGAVIAALLNVPGKCQTMCPMSFH